MALITAIKIDCLRKSVEFVTIDNGNDGIYSALECSTYEHFNYVSPLHGPRGEANMLLIDEEARIRKDGPDGWFIFDNYIFKGHGLIVGFNAYHEDYMSSSVDIDNIRSRIKFPDNGEELSASARNKSEWMPELTYSLN